MPDMINPFEGLTEKQREIIEQASKLAREKQESGEMPFPFGVFHPDVLKLLQTAANQMKEKGDA